jgi:NAD-dependent SIR2 family protein deacetylase
MKERKCVKCGARLTDEDVMKIKKENGSWEEIPLSICPDCFTKQMRKQARAKTSGK